METEIPPGQHTETVISAQVRVCTAVKSQQYHSIQAFHGLGGKAGSMLLPTGGGVPTELGGPTLSAAALAELVMGSS